MFVWSFRMNRRELIITGVGLAIFVILAALLLVTADRRDRTTDDGVSLCAATAQERAEFLGSYGWQTESTPLSVREVVIPRSFDADFREYSELQKKQGFDLEALKGERVKLYSYRVTNYPIGREEVAANLLVKDGVIVGGDICPTSADGTAQGFDPELFGTEAAAIQLDRAAQTIDRSVPDYIPANSDALPEPDSDGEW